MKKVKNIEKTSRGRYILTITDVYGATAYYFLDTRSIEEDEKEWVAQIIDHTLAIEKMKGSMLKRLLKKLRK